MGDGAPTDNHAAFHLTKWLTHAAATYLLK